MKHGLFNPALLQQMLFRALDDSDDLVLVLEQIGAGAAGLVIAAANEAFTRVSGYRPEDLVGRPLLSLAAPDLDPAAADGLLQAAQNRQSFRSEILCAGATGKQFWLGLHLMPVARTSPPCSVLLGRDITDARRDRQQHAAVQGLLAKVFISVHAAVGILDEQGTILMTNPALDELLGYRPGGLLGKTGVDLIAVELRPAVLDARQRQMGTGESYQLEAMVQHADGSMIRLELGSTMVQREDLKRFRIITLNRIQVAKPAQVRVHIAGKIKLIGLEDVKTSLGSRWPAVAARVMASAEHVLRQRCGPRDSWSRTTDSGFVVCFGDVTEDEAAVRATALARDIRARLIGQGEAASSTYVSAVTGAVELPDDPDRSADMLGLALGQRLNARLQEIEARARATLRKAVLGATCELAAIRSRHMGEIIAHFANLPRALEQQLQCALMALPIRDRETFDFDRLVLGAAAELVVATIEAGSTLPVLIPIAFDVFLDRRCTDRYIAACKQLDERVRSRLIFVIAHLPLGVPRNRVLQCAVRLRPFCQTVAFECEGLELPPLETSLLSGSIVVLQEALLGRWTEDELVRLSRLIELVRCDRARLDGPSGQQLGQCQAAAACRG